MLFCCDADHLAIGDIGIGIKDLADIKFFPCRRLGGEQKILL